MKKITTILCLSFFVVQCFCQIGISGGYKTFNADSWNTMSQNDLDVSAYPMAGWQIGADYWFRLKKRRIEFLPELSFASFQSSFQEGSLQHRQISFHFNTDVYIFDLASDCHCPTFSKNGSFFSRGFFIELSPGASRITNQLDLNNPTTGSPQKGKEYTFGGAVGAGLDLGFSDLFTITPLFRYYFYPNTGWDYELVPANGQATLKQIFLGLRFRVHFKEFANARYH